MKIAIVVPSLKKTAPVNIAVSVYEKSKIQNNKKTKIDLYYLDSEKTENCYDIDNAIHLKNKKVLRKYDIVHSHGLRPDIINFIYSKERIRITTIHSFIEKDLFLRYGIKGRIIAKIWLFILKYFSICITINNIANNFYSQKNLNCCTIYNGIEFDKFDVLPNKYDKLKSEIKDKFSNKIIIGSISHLEKIKGLYQLIKLVSEYDCYRAVIIGSGSQENDLIKYAKKLRAYDKIIFTGYLEHGSNYSSLFDVYIQPSLNEGFGLSIIEAIAKKVSIVCSDIPIFKELFSDDEVTFFELHNISSLHRAVQISLKNTEKKEKAYSLATNKFNQDHMIKSYINIYEKNTNRK
ncbi:glycosyltransferase family 4 protein [Xenorhabdus sp. PB62.4]|uniref:glycosyltransferase family 4 protein n=1 Tax=Xenorhabdus sp. PB62.4 TaxID=1851573 RepID=UPI0016568FC5|nr:glycosyltransferase family 4 protein [Xenorhabdus sp. PB62.4]MBC8954431.1 putative lipopolysaccharide biosynthesis protein [Xenorhabdus sp. PB62.4]